MLHVNINNNSNKKYNRVTSRANGDLTTTKNDRRQGLGIKNKNNKKI